MIKKGAHWKTALKYNACLRLIEGDNSLHSARRQRADFNVILNPIALAMPHGVHGVNGRLRVSRSIARRQFTCTLSVGLGLAAQGWHIPASSREFKTAKVSVDRHI